MPARESLPLLRAETTEARKAPREDACGTPAGRGVLQYAPAASRWTRIGAAPGRPRAWLALALLAGAGLFGLGLGMGLTPGRMAGEALRNLLFAADAFWKILPYFAASVLISAWATTSGLAERVQILFRRGEVPAILGAAAVGAVVPLCSCGVIPAIAALLAGGVPLGPVMAFWISAPVMSPEKFTLMAGVLGLPYALMNLASAVAIGAGAGLAARFAVRRGLLAGQIKPLGGAGACCGAASPSPPDQGAASAGAYRNTPLQGGPGGMAPALSPFVRQAAASALFLGKWLALAFLLEALTTHYVDPAWIQALLGGSSPWSIPLATAVGIPLYVSGVAAIPIVGGLLEGGMSPGAAMAFLVAGPVTTVCAVGAVLALVRGRAFALYLGSGILGSLAAGYAFQWMMG